MLDDLYQAGTDAALNDLAARPLAQPTASPKFSAWRTIKAAPKGVAQGANEAAGFFSDALWAFGTIQASQLDSDPMARAVLGDQAVEQGAKEAQKRLQSGEAFTSQMGEDFRATAKDFMPDPTTSHAAERVVQGLTRFGVKAVGYAGAGPAGPVLLGSDEANQVSADLKAQGVDPETRAKVAALSGVTAAASVVLPVAGATVRQTIGLTAVGGPGMFMAQNAATREILQSAGYDQQAAQYDPFDPVGLAVSTLIPAGFGAWAMRGAKLRPAGEARPVEGAQAAEHAVPEVMQPTPEHVDAARVELLNQHTESTRLTPPEDFAGSNAHLTAVSRAIDQMGRGERVSVEGVAPSVRTQSLAEFMGSFKGKADAAPPEVKSSFFAWLRDRGGIDAAQRLDITGEASGVRGNPGGIFRKGGRGLDELARQAEIDGFLPPGSVDSGGDNGGTRAMAELIRRATSGDHPLTMAEQVAKAQRDQHMAGMDQRLSEVEARLQAVGVDTTPARGNLAALLAYEKANGPALLGAALDELRALHAADHMPSAAGALDARAAQIADDIQMTARTLAQYEADIRPLSPVMRKMVERKLQEPANVQDATQPAAKQDATARSQTDAAAPEPATANARSTGTADGQSAAAADAGRTAAEPQAAGVGQGAKAETASHAARLAEIQAEFPDLEVMLDGMDKPAKLSEFLADIQRQAMEGTDFELGGNDAPLMQVAANCFLLNGG